MQTWRGGTATSASGAMIGALLGWVLSLTQGTHPVHWPWIVIGGAVGGVLFLYGWERRYVRKHAPKPLKATDIIIPYLRDAGIRQEKIDTLTTLITEGTRVLDQLKAHGGDWVDIHLVPEWTQRADDTLRRDFGSPHDALARSHSHGTAPPYLRSRARTLWEEADKRRGQITDMLKELSPLSH